MENTSVSPAGTAAGPGCLEAVDLACNRGDTRLLSGFSLRVSGGEAVQIAGANGRGKTTLLRVLSGLTRPAAGQVRWNHADVHDADGYQGDLLYLAHENALNPDLTARENLIALGRLYRPRPDVTSALKTLGVDGFADRLCGRLSAGQRRRTALARLALAPVALWLLDEPAAALDADGRALLGRLIADHAAAGGLVVFTTHEPLALPGLSPRRVELS